MKNDDKFSGFSSKMNSKWEVEFELEQNRYQINYNKIEDNVSKREPKYTESTVIDRRSTVADLKL